MINIAIDGPAGSGKSTVAKIVSKKLDYIYLDTGAMYRASAVFALNNGVDVQDEKQVCQVIEKFTMDIIFEDGQQQIFVNGENVTPFLREHKISKAASDISKHACVRYKMVELQRNFAKLHNVVLDGRDIGTFVLPNARYKFFLTASLDERAKRRFLELEQKGEKVNFDDLLQDIKLRDYNDSHREVAPLKQAEDAVYIDTTMMNLEKVVETILSSINRG